MKNLRREVLEACCFCNYLSYHDTVVLRFSAILLWGFCRSGMIHISPTICLLTTRLNAMSSAMHHQRMHQQHNRQGNHLDRLSHPQQCKAQLSRRPNIGNELLTKLEQAGKVPSREKFRRMCCQVSSLWMVDFRFVVDYTQLLTAHLNMHLDVPRDREMSLQWSMRLFTWSTSTDREFPAEGYQSYSGTWHGQGHLLLARHGGNFVINAVNYAIYKSIWVYSLRDYLPTDGRRELFTWCAGSSRCEAGLHNTSWIFSGNLCCGVICWGNILTPSN